MRDGNQWHQQAESESESADDIEVSVIVPVLNGAQTIGDQLAALARQRTARLFEVLICDNGSTDDTLHVVERWRSLLPGLKVIDAGDRKGPSHARNCGILAARGRLLVFCDADDVVDDFWLDEFAAKANPKVLLSGWTEYRSLNPEYEIYGDGISKDLILREGYLFSIDSANFAMMRADALVCGGFDESMRYVEDVDLAWRAQQASMSIQSVPAVVHSRLRDTPAGEFKQRRHWGEYSILLRVRNATFAPMAMSFKYSVLTLLKTALGGPWEWVFGDSRRRKVLLGALGALLGETVGHLRYRLMRNLPDRQLLRQSQLSGVSPIKRVIFSVDDLGNLGGVQTFVDTLATEFLERGIDISYITLSPQVRPPKVDGRVFVINKHMEHTGNHPQAELYRGPLGSKYLIKRILATPWRVWRNWRYRRFVERLDSATAIIFTQPESVDMLFQSGYRPEGSEKGPLIISQLHTSFKGMHAWNLEQMMGRVIAQSDVFLTLCEADAREFAARFGHPVSVMTNPSLVATVPGVDRALPPELIYAGRLSAEKRVDLIIEAFDIAADQVADWLLVIYGDGVLLDELRQQVAGCRNSSRIEFSGRISDISTAFSSASLAVLASSFEGLPMSLIEAARCGVPTVATLSSEGVSSVVSECGYPVADATSLGLSRVLVEAMTDSESRLRLGEQCLVVGARFDVVRVADEWVSLFKTFARSDPVSGSRRRTG